ncbi:permease for cytosine/purines, uracil, thiamine, allantoin-domain-containing protein [Fomitopsis betulina]|nr:permease for cytosine/purines, uracil, thiamine, allantoin-domain-containing protein [Fomitopsis betulina]
MGMRARTSLQQFIRRLEVHQDGSRKDMSYAEGFLKNDDLYPVSSDKRTWGMWNFIAFWVADSFNINTWEIASSMVDAGLSWWQAWICVWIGYGVVAPFIVLNARPGAKFHITFPVVARASFGIWGSLCVWYGVQASIGGTCVLVMLRAMWPSVENIPNSMPASSGTNTRDFMCFFLFWLISLPAIWMPIHKVRHLFTIKAIIVPIAGIAFFIWCIVKAHGVGPIVRQPSKIHGSSLGWAMVANLMSCVSNMATLVTNAPDFASRARKPRDALWPQLLAVPLGFSTVSFLGIIVSSSSQAIYGQPVWSPITLLGMFLDDSPSHATRFGVWFIAAAFIIAQNIRRGGYIAAIVGLCMLPWNLLKSSNNFTTYLSAYSVFLSSIAGVMITDYYVIRKGQYRVSDLYHAKKSGWYAYTYGINFRAYAAYIAGILINVVGFAGATGRPVPEAAIHIYDMSFFTGFGVSAVVYWFLNLVFPAAGASRTFQEIDHSGMSDTAPMDEEFAMEEELDRKCDEKADGTASVRSVVL